jgi:cyclase
MKRSLLLSVFLVFLSVTFLAAQETTQGSSDSKSQNNGVFVSAKKIKDSLYYLTYKNNNAVAFLGREYTLLIDGFDAKAAPQALNAAGRLSLNPVRFLVNTHHHKDHTGGNEYYSNSGVTVMCHRQTYSNIWNDVNAKELEKIQELKQRIIAQQKGQAKESSELNAKIEKLQKEGLEQDLSYPAFLFGDEFSMNLVNESIEIKHIRYAHTSGDVVMYFKNNNVLATGDLFFNGKYPYIDEDMGGNIDNYIEALDTLAKMCNNDTVIVPGHGPLASKSDLESYKRMLEYTQKGVQMDYLLGKSLEEVLANKAITANFDAQGYGLGYVKTQDYVSMLYRAAEKRYPRKK